MLGLFKKKESLVAMDIGSSSIKLLELDLTGSKPKLVNIGLAPLQHDLITTNSIAKADKVAEKIAALADSNGVAMKRFTVAMPGPSVFTKRIQTQLMNAKDLSENIQFEAGNYIPHSIEAVRLDHHVLGENGKSQLEVLLVAVKNEIIDSYVDTMGVAGLQTAIVDVDYFALQNCFETGYPELRDKTVAIVNIGARYTSVNMTRGGQTLFTGDVSVGGRAITEEIAEALGVPFDEAETLKIRHDKSHPRAAEIAEVMDRSTEQMASELNRQLNFFWNSTGEKDGIDQIMLCGGGSLVPGLLEELVGKTGIDCHFMDPLRGIEHSVGFEADYLKDLSPKIGVAVGLGLRELGDKISNFEGE